MKKHILSLTALGFLLTGCVVTSLHPFYTEKDLVLDASLGGHWKNADPANEHWIFEPADAKSWKLTYTSGNETNLMSAHLFKLDKQMYMDLFPLSMESAGMPPAIPSHLVLRVDQIRPTLKMAVMKHEWLAKFVEAHPKAIGHMTLRDGEKSDNVRVVLTAETPALQKFLRKHATSAEAWEDPSDLVPDK